MKYSQSEVRRELKKVGMKYAQSRINKLISDGVLSQVQLFNDVPKKKRIKVRVMDPSKLTKNRVS